ncbi:MAG: hypothetical protein NTY02_10745 [Acidobacteria bacterium]|nr:hypothetical protein [Acidobacteriota bacterium]
MNGERSRGRIVMVCGLVLLLAGAGACSRAPKTAAEVVARSVDAHGGAKLTAWKTMTAKGRVRMQDGIAYNAAYLLYARPPGQLRVEHDLTADRGRAFSEYFLSDGVAWIRRNLVVSSYDTARAQRLLDQCYGIAFYQRNGTALALRGDEDVVWPAVEGWDPKALPPARRAWTIGVMVGKEARTIFIDKETFLLLKEISPAGTRYYADVKSFGGVMVPTRVLDVTKARDRESQTPFTIETVAFDVAIEAGLFTEDMPKAAQRKAAGANVPE